ncbi:hypothetical protein M413DRAFT_423882 [Hebeloma cylindrosporum]|uniref:F-box domain-containing protein n=1 Tax=Hebeloma cylindrosporum TaxID=76867 RepID=A0A0C3BYC0_HEBCY|nr:hypothetical protein M413DRAFT_423882 [Hebeloma cylindrosporum h7]
MCKDEAPMLLTVICSHWRRVALSTPRIWAAIHIPIPQPESIPESPPGEDGEDVMIQRRCNGVKEFLSRSGSLPLMISIYFNGLWGSSVSRRTTALVKIIIPFAERWKDISIAGPSSAFSPIRELQSDFPELRSLRLGVVRHNVHGGVTFSWKDSKVVKAKGLRSFSLTSMDENTMDYLVRWSHLTDLSLEVPRDWIASAFKSIAVHRILQMSPALISCKLAVRHETLDFDKKFSSVSLRHLENLKIEEPTQWPNLFGSFDVPSLKSLEYFTKQACPSGRYDEDLDINNPINDNLLQLLAPRKLPHDLFDTHPEAIYSINQLCPRVTEFIVHTQVHDIVPDLSAFITSGLKVRLQYAPPALRGPLSLYDGLPYEIEEGPYIVIRQS